MSDRMEKTREALSHYPYDRNRHVVDAALAEVEEWETRLAEAEHAAVRAVAGSVDRARMPLQQRVWLDSVARAEAAEAERDRLKTLEPYAHYAHSEGCAANGWAANASPCDCGLDALLARAALGEQNG